MPVNPLQPLIEHLRDSPAVPSAARTDAQLSVPPDVQALWMAVMAHRHSFASASQPIVAVLPTAVAAEDLARELAVWLGEGEVECLPAWETFPFERVSPTLQSMGDRQRILWRLRGASAQGRDGFGGRAHPEARAGQPAGDACGSLGGANPRQGSPHQPAHSRRLQAMPASGAQGELGSERLYLGCL